MPNVAFWVPVPYRSKSGFPSLKLFHPQVWNPSGSWPGNMDKMGKGHMWGLKSPHNNVSTSVDTLAIVSCAGWAISCHCSSWCFPGLGLARALSGILVHCMAKFNRPRWSSTKSHRAWARACVEISHRTYQLPGLSTPLVFRWIEPSKCGSDTSSYRQLTPST